MFWIIAWQIPLTISLKWHQAPLLHVAISFMFDNHTQGPFYKKTPNSGARYGSIVLFIQGVDRKSMVV